MHNLHGPFLCKFTKGKQNNEARFFRASFGYLEQILPHPAQLPLQPQQPPFARDLTMERTAASTIAASTLKTMMSPMTVTSLKKIVFERQKTYRVFSLCFGV